MTPSWQACVTHRLLLAPSTPPQPGGGGAAPPGATWLRAHLQAAHGSRGSAVPAAISPVPPRQQQKQQQQQHAFRLALSGTQVLELPLG
eukprot:364177-Chlamydomonas_euryale.AAC.3